MRRFCLCGLCLLHGAASWGQEGDLFEFFREEAQVITASRRPQPLYRAPATVYVISGEELRTSGAQTLWDGLRRVPGMDVINIRSLSGVISIRGLNKPLNNRTLVLVDGRNALEGYYDNVNLETIPVLLEEIDRIEVVEGPISALYGANAINGVINIITRKPEQLQGGQVRLGMGEPGARQVSFLYGKKGEKWGYRLGLGRRITDHFGEGEGRAASLTKFSGMVDYPLGEDSWIRCSAGVTEGDVDVALGGLGKAAEDGERWYARADYVRRNTRMRVFWKGSDTQLKGILEQQDPQIDYYTYEGILEQILGFSANHNLVLGGSFRRNVIDAEMVVSARHNLWSLYFEDEWNFARQWTLWSSGRLDRHPYSGLVLSPRFSLICVPLDQHVLRFSTGTSFRNPTQLENHIEVAERVEFAGDFVDLQVEIDGSTGLDPELMFFAEVVHNAQLGHLRTTAGVFHYRLRDIISIAQPEVSLAEPGVIQARVTFANRGETRAWGGELGAEWTWRDWSGYANYAYQRLNGELDTQVSEGGRPRHKINGGVRIERAHWQASASLHWVDWTRWNENRLPRTQATFVKVDGYTLVNGYLGYRLPGRWRRLEMGLNTSNLWDDEHYETLPSGNPFTPGQGGELIGRRSTAMVSWLF